MRNSRLFKGAVVWNRIDDAVRWASPELRRLCPEPEFGTRTIARHLVRAGIAVSRSTVQRAVREKTVPGSPKPKKPPMCEPIGHAPDHLIKPTHVNHVWHMDLTYVRILWFGFTLAAILDGFSRKLLALKAYAETPRTREMTRLVRHTANDCGTPRFLITDHGPQFSKRFRSHLANKGITQVQSRVRAPFLNGKMERAFRPFKCWWRMTLVGLNPRHMQCHLDSYRHWHNEHRPHGALAGRTPEEVWRDKRLPTPLPYRTSNPLKFNFEVRRNRLPGRFVAAGGSHHGPRGMTLVAKSPFHFSKSTGGIAVPMRSVSGANYTAERGLAMHSRYVRRRLMDRIYFSLRRHNPLGHYRFCGRDFSPMPRPFSL